MKEFKKMGVCLSIYQTDSQIKPKSKSKSKSKPNIINKKSIDLIKLKEAENQFIINKLNEEHRRFLENPKKFVSEL